MNVVDVYVVVHRCVASFPKGMLTFVSAVMSIDKVTSFVTSGDKPIPCHAQEETVASYTNQKVPTLGLLNSIFVGYLPTTMTLAESANSSCILCFVWKAVHSKLIFHQTELYRRSCSCFKSWEEDVWNSKVLRMSLRRLSVFFLPSSWCVFYVLRRS